MNERQFMDIVDLAWADIKGAAPGTAAGIFTVVIHRDEDDEMSLQVGTTVPPAIVVEVLEHLLDQAHRGRMKFTPLSKTKRKIV